MLLLVGPLSVLAQTVEQESGELSYYNDKYQFGLPVPQGWENNSTEDIIHFRQPDTGVNLYALAQPVVNTDQALDAGLGQVGLDLQESPQTSEINQSGNLWIQRIYVVDDTQSIKALAQTRGSYTYIIVWDGDATALADLESLQEKVLADFFITPQTSPYLLLGIGVSLLIMCAFLATMLLRYRSLQKDIALIERLRAEET